MTKPKRATDWPWAVTPESKVIPAADIKKDDALQVRTKLDMGQARKYAHEMKAGMKFPPVVIASIDGVSVLVDGWHRMEAAVLINGQEAIEATITLMTRAEATWEAAKANLTHGQPYKAKEKRNVLRAYIKAGKHKEGRRIVLTYRDISAELGIKIGTLHRWMEADHPHTFRAMGKDDNHTEPAEPPVVDTDPENLRRAQQALREALAYCDALGSPQRRFEVIAAAEEVAEKMKRKEHAEPYGWL
ncbi:MAG: hypothetical protein ACYCY9_03795 [Thiobacillus sp.]